MVKELISISPGIHLRRLQKLLDLSFSTTRYHVNNLLRDGEVVSSPDGGYTRLYPVGTADDMKAIYACLQNENVRAVFNALLSGESAQRTQGELSEKLGLPRSTLSECEALLGRVGLAKRSFALDGRVVYDVRDKEQAAALLQLFARRGILDKASDRFIDLWDW